VNFGCPCLEEEEPILRAVCITYELVFLDNNLNAILSLTLPIYFKPNEVVLVVELDGISIKFKRVVDRGFVETS